MPSRCAPRIRRNTSSARWKRWLSMFARCWNCKNVALSPSIMATTFAPRPRMPASRTPTIFPVLFLNISARSFAKEKDRSAGLHSAETRMTSRGPTRSMKLAKERIHFQGLPARICWLGYGERAEFGVAMNELVRHGEVKAPIVIGRDHLDTGSVASPFRETEGMLDGSDAIADWPLLNALVNTAAGASWISIHNGGGVGIGY